MPAFDRRVRDFEAANTQVLGISADSPFSHENWAKAVGISHYPLLSDIHRATSRDYGVYWPDWNANVRATFVIDRQGTIRFVERYGRGELPDPARIPAENKRLSWAAAPAAPRGPGWSGPLRAAPARRRRPPATRWSRPASPTPAARPRSAGGSGRRRRAPGPRLPPPLPPPGGHRGGEGLVEPHEPRGL